MFALWYLTFAVDEIRKRLAWLFGPKQRAPPAIDNKAVPAAAVAPKPAPAPAPAPVAQPSNKENIPPPAPQPAAAPVSPPKPSTPTPPVVTKPAPAAPAPTAVVAPTPAPTPTPVVTPKQAVTPPAAPSKAADKMPIPLPKSLTEANTNGNGNGTATNGNNNYDERELDQKLFDGQLPPTKVAKVDNNEQLKDASNDFIKGEANAFVQSIKQAQQAGATRYFAGSSQILNAQQKAENCLDLRNLSATRRRQRQ
ncbi:hypothetical protein ACLKA6_011455 [Drosophila palustris]